jgi:hypothetical protein
MMTRPVHTRCARPAAASHRAAYTLTEYLVAVGVIGLLALAGTVFVESTGRTLESVTTQSGFNQMAGHAAEFLMQRIRLANSASNSSSGDVLTLSFDDNPDVDSNGDKLTWNDKDHFEEFRLNSGDGQVPTLTDNTITYHTNVMSTNSAILVPGYARKLSNQPIFALTNQSTVLINFGLLFTNRYAQSQMIEIRTKARLRNRTQ